MPKKDDGGGVQVPADLSSLTDEELSQLSESATAEFDRLTDDENLDAPGLARASQLAEDLERVNGESTARAEALEAQRQEVAALRARVHPEGDGEVDDTDAGEGDGATDTDAGATTAEPALVAGARRKTDVRDVLRNSTSKLNVKLSQARSGNTSASQAPPRNSAVLVASADVRGFTQGSQLEGMNGLVAAMQARARNLPASHGNPNFVPVAQLQRDQDFRYVIDDHSTPQEVYEVLQAAANPDALVAAGGWCSPSEISYDFYNIVCEDGMLDIPTTGIRRGGMRWPTSPSFGDLASSTGLWVWTETQDIAAATGTAQSGTKTCARVPCASFNEARLDCDGLCITAGNLTTDAWPEQIANFMRLVMAAHAHRVNTRLINKLVALSTGVALGVSGQGVAVPVLDAIEMTAIDIRNKYAMCDNATLEGVFPNWVFGMIRADLAKRKGYDSPASSFNITNAEIAAWFTARGISAQFVQDWQVRAAGYPGQSSAMTAWPSTVQFMMYPAGTFVKGNGLSLDLGVVRDSTLNATNDYTAAWSEDCWLTAMIGHESRVITVPVCANGAVGSDITYACPAF